MEIEDVVTLVQAIPANVWNTSWCPARPIVLGKCVLGLPSEKAGWSCAGGGRRFAPGTASSRAAPRARTI